MLKADQFNLSSCDLIEKFGIDHTAIMNHLDDTEKVNNLTYGFHLT